MTTPHEIAEYLRSLPHVHDVRSRLITIAGIDYPAAWYKQVCTTPEGSPAYQRGERCYVREMLYVVGMLPKAYLRNSRIKFNLQGDTRDWYVACYAGEVYRHRQTTWAPREYHPFGNSFCLAPWDDTLEPLDHYETRPRQVLRVVSQPSI